LWQQLVAVAPQLGIEAPAVTGETPYNPVLYRRVYASLLRYRQVQVIPLTTALPTTTWSVHAFAMPRRDVIPDLNETQRLIAAVEAQYPDVTLLQRVLAQWYNL
jgi:hypothetical protein